MTGQSSQLLFSLVPESAGESDEESLEAAVKKLLKGSGSADDLHYLIVAASDMQRLNWAYHIIDRLSHRLDSIEGVDMEDLIDELLLPNLDQGDPRGLMEQARRNAERREAFLAEFPCLKAEELDQPGDAGAENGSSLVSKWTNKREIFGLNIHGTPVFPSFQFQVGGQPKPAIAEVLRALGPDIGPWQTAIWFTTPNSALERKKPVDLLDKESERVVAAARRLSEPNLF